MKDKANSATPAQVEVAHWSLAELRRAWPDLRHLVFWTGHSSHISRHRGQLIASRVKFVSALFAVLTPAWIIVDALVFPWPVWGLLALLRLASAAAFAGLAWMPVERASLRRARTMLTGMLAIPPLFFLAAQPLLGSLPSDGVMGVVVDAYALLPFVVVAGLSIFPMTAMEVAVASSPVVAVVIISAVTQATASLSELINALWLMGLVIGVAAFSGMSQLHYMIALINQATRDALTGAFTRRSGEETLDLQFRIAARTGQPMSVAFVDVDFFKSVNDEFGHEAGDQTLRSVSERLAGLLRRSDVLVRWGGEEFVLVLPNTSTAGMANILARISESGFGTRPDGKPVTVSMGIAERISDDVHDWDRLIELSDERMYKAKHGGRNACLGPDDASSRMPLLPLD